MVKYDRCSDFVINAVENRDYDLYLLCSPDIPWAFDPQRENPSDRSVLYELYKKELEFYGKTFFELKGSTEERLEEALRQIKELM